MLLLVLLMLAFGEGGCGAYVAGLLTGARAGEFCDCATVVERLLQAWDGGGAVSLPVLPGGWGCR